MSRMSTLAMPTAEHTVPAGVETDPDFSQYPARLPEFGTIGDDENTHGMALAYFQKIGRAARDGREDPVEQAVSNAKTYQWGQEFKPCDGEIISNEIMGCVLAITDLQTREPEPILIRPVQTRDKPQVFWIGPPVTPDVSAVTGLPPGLGMEPVIDPTTGQPALQPVTDPMSGQPVGVEPMMQPASTYQPLDDLTAWQLKKLATAGAFPPEWMVAVDDRLVADVYQTIFDVMWKESHLDDFVYENVLKTNIYGYQGSYYSWDAQKKKHIVRDVSIKQLLLDASAEGSSFELQRCPGFDVVMDIDQAKAEWPQLANVVDKYAKEGYPKRFDGNTDFGTASDRDFGRRTVTFRIYWFRDQVVPMLPQEAEAAGLVTLDTDPMTGEPFYRSTQVMEAPNAVQEQGLAGVDVRQQTGDGQAIAGGYAEGQEAAQEGQEEVGYNAEQQNGYSDPNQQFDNGADVSGSPASQLPQSLQTDPSQLPQDVGSNQVPPDGSGGQATQPASLPSPMPSWPMTLAIRQMAGLAQAGRIVQDIRCEHWDIPMTLNVCIPLPSQPFGQGLPEKLKGMQEADIRLLTACVKYAETFSNPGSMVPQSVANALAKGLKRTHVDPKETLIIPDDLARQWGDKAILWFQPPPLPPAIANVMAMLQDRTQRTSGHSEVMQGNAPSPTSSGKLVEALQAGQTGMAMFQAQWTARMRERLANLMHYTHLWRLGVSDIMQIYSRLPEQIMELVVERARRNKWDNHVDANAGGAAAKKLQQALALFSAVSSTGEPALPLRMLREAANIDPEEASIAYRQEVQNAMPQQPTAAPAPHDPSGANPNANQPVMA